MTPLVIFGASGHARVIADAAHASGRFNVIGMIDNAFAPGTPVARTQVLGGDEILTQLVAGHEGLHGVIGVGDNRLRRAIAISARERVAGFPFAAVIHPSAVVASDVTIGEGTFVAAGVTINCGARIGSHVVVNTAASVDHDCVVEEFAFLAPRVALAGNVKIGRDAFLGIAACAIPGVAIGAGAVVGAGAAVIEDVAPNAVVVGVPARQSGWRKA